MNVLRLPFLFSLRRFPPLGVWCLVQRAHISFLRRPEAGGDCAEEGSRVRVPGGECAGLTIYLLSVMELAPSVNDKSFKVKNLSCPHSRIIGGE